MFHVEIDSQISDIIELIQSERSAALERLRKLAKDGNRTAIVLIGLYLSEAPIASTEAIEWLAIATTFGSEQAAWNLAMIANHENDQLRVRHWIDEAAMHGEADAIKVQQEDYSLKSFIIQ